MPKPLVLRNAPLPRDLRQLLEQRGSTRSAASEHSGIQPHTLNRILEVS